MRAAVALVAERLKGQEVLFIALGEERTSGTNRFRLKLRFVPYQKDPGTVARYYQGGRCLHPRSPRRGVGSYDYRGACLRDSSGRNSGWRDR